eukprot:scaffold27255_cov104-Isochrysis_galbana.AAC.3
MSINLVIFFLAIIVRLVNRIRKISFSQPRPVSRAWFSPSFMRCTRPCTPPVRLSSVYSVHIQPSIRHLHLFILMVLLRKQEVHDL